MSLSNDAEVKVLNHIFRNAEAVYTPGAQYISLHTGNPGEANDGGNEVSGYNYARVLSSDKFGGAAAGAVACSLTRGSGCCRSGCCRRISSWRRRPVGRVAVRKDGG